MAAKKFDLTPEMLERWKTDPGYRAKDIASGSSLSLSKVCTALRAAFGPGRVREISVSKRLSGGPVARRGEEVKRRYLAGEAADKIAEELSVSPTTVVAFLRREGVPVRSGGKRKPSLLPEARVVARYLTGPESSSALALAYQTTRAKILAVLHSSLDPAEIRRVSLAKGPLAGKEREVARKYIEGAERKSLAKEFGVTDSAILGLLRREGVPVRKRASRKPPPATGDGVA